MDMKFRFSSGQAVLPDADAKLAETVRQVNQNYNQACPQFRVVEVACEIFLAGITKQDISQLFFSRYKALFFFLMCCKTAKKKRPKGQRGMK